MKNLQKWLNITVQTALGESFIGILQNLSIMQVFSE